MLETGVENVEIINNATGKTENIIKLTPTVSKFFLSVSQDDPPSASEGNTTQLNIVYHTRSMTGLWRQGINKTKRNAVFPQNPCSFKFDCFNTTQYESIRHKKTLHHGYMYHAYVYVSRSRIM